MSRILITGAGSGLGKIAAIELAKRGHTVFATTHYENQIEDLRKIAFQLNLDLHAFLLNVLEESDRNLILDYDIDTFISNAAIGTSGSVADVNVDDIINVFNTNVFANLKSIQIALRNMIENKKEGRIIILSSLVGRIPMPFLSPYCSSKFALEGFGICLRQEMRLLNKLSGTHICVSLIEPGAYATGFNKENNNEKYEWMYEHSYFSKYADWIRKREIKIWNFLEQKPYTSIIKKYIRAVEDKKPKFRYTAPWWQSLCVQLGRMLGM